ncbi:MAG: 23S rRNA (guanosine(2251)-2'-O)-methyltransferase RlmB [Bacilli bacterium]|nr:23S rRNA (guanosine(2251)-2'-O)-methyltransferase RlmB [Bacilli bacterium]
MFKLKTNHIYGRNPVKEALLADRVKEIFLTDNFSHREILDLISKKHIKTTIVSRRELDQSIDGVHQGVVADIKEYQYSSYEEILKQCQNKKDAIILILDGINDPQNFGAILRSADVFDVSGIILSKHEQVPLNATVAKTSAGAINYVPVCAVNNLNQTIEKLKKDGFWVVASDGSGTYNYQDINYDFKVALVIGSEGQGVSKLVLKNADYVIKIPQFGHVNSLNASVAAGILLAKIRQ